MSDNVTVSACLKALESGRQNATSPCVSPAARSPANELYSHASISEPGYRPTSALLLQLPDFVNSIRTAHLSGWEETHHEEANSPRTLSSTYDIQHTTRTAEAVSARPPSRTFQALENVFSRVRRLPPPSASGVVADEEADGPAVVTPKYNARMVHTPLERRGSTSMHVTFLSNVSSPARHEKSNASLSPAAPTSHTKVGRANTLRPIDSQSAKNKRGFYTLKPKQFIETSNSTAASPARVLAKEPAQPAPSQSSQKALHTVQLALAPDINNLNATHSTAAWSKRVPLAGYMPGRQPRIVTAYHAPVSHNVVAGTGGVGHAVPVGYADSTAAAAREMQMMRQQQDRERITELRRQSQLADSLAAAVAQLRSALFSDDAASSPSSTRQLFRTTLIQPNSDRGMLVLQRVERIASYAKSRIEAQLAEFMSRPPAYYERPAEPPSKGSASMFRSILFDPTVIPQSRQVSLLHHSHTEAAGRSPRRDGPGLHYETLSFNAEGTNRALFTGLLARGLLTSPGDQRDLVDDVSSFIPQFDRLSTSDKLLELAVAADDAAVLAAASAAGITISADRLQAILRAGYRLASGQRQRDGTAGEISIDEVLNTVRGFQNDSPTSSPIALDNSEDAQLRNFVAWWSSQAATSYRTSHLLRTVTNVLASEEAANEIWHSTSDDAAGRSRLLLEALNDEDVVAAARAAGIDLPVGMMASGPHFADMLGLAAGSSDDSERDDTDSEMLDVENLRKLTQSSRSSRRASLPSTFAYSTDGLDAAQQLSGVPIVRATSRERPLSKLVVATNHSQALMESSRAIHRTVSGNEPTVVLSPTGGKTGFSEMQPDPQTYDEVLVGRGPRSARLPEGELVASPAADGPGSGHAGDSELGPQAEGRRSKVRPDPSQQQSPVAVKTARRTARYSAPDVTANHAPNVATLEALTQFKQWFEKDDGEAITKVRNTFILKKLKQASNDIARAIQQKHSATLVQAETPNPSSSNKPKSRSASRERPKSMSRKASDGKKPRSRQSRLSLVKDTIDGQQQVRMISHSRASDQEDSSYDSDEEHGSEDLSPSSSSTAVLETERDELVLQRRASMVVVKTTTLDAAAIIREAEVHCRVLLAAVDLLAAGETRKKAELSAMEAETTAAMDQDDANELDCPRQDDFRLIDGIHCLESGQLIKLLTGCDPSLHSSPWFIAPITDAEVTLQCISAVPSSVLTGLHEPRARLREEIKDAEQRLSYIEQYKRCGRATVQEALARQERFRWAQLTNEQKQLAAERHGAARDELARRKREDKEREVDPGNLTVAERMARCRRTAQMVKIAFPAFCERVRRIAELRKHIAEEHAMLRRVRQLAVAQVCEIASQHRQHKDAAQDRTDYEIQQMQHEDVLASMREQADLQRLSKTLSALNEAYAPFTPCFADSDDDYDYTPFHSRSACQSSLQQHRMSKSKSTVAGIPSPASNKPPSGRLSTQHPGHSSDTSLLEKRRLMGDDVPSVGFGGFTDLSLQDLIFGMRADSSSPARGPPSEVAPTCTGKRSASTTASVIIKRERMVQHHRYAVAELAVSQSTPELRCAIVDKCLADAISSKASPTPSNVPRLKPPHMGSRTVSTDINAQVVANAATKNPVAAMAAVGAFRNPLGERLIGLFAPH